MASAWFVRQTDKVYGPFDTARLKKLAAAERILRDSGISKDPHGPWTQATRVRGLFSDANPEAPATKANEGSFGLDLLVETAASAVSRWRGLLRLRSIAQKPDGPADRSQWFYRAVNEGVGVSKGPYSRSQIDQLIERGDVRASTLVLELGQKRWETAFTAGLFLDDPLQEDGKGGPGASDGDNSASVGPNDREEILWEGRASHYSQFGIYALCALAAPLVFPFIWGVRTYVARDCLRYQITSRRVRIKYGSDSTQSRDIPLASIRDAALVCPPALKPTHLCNIELRGEGGTAPLAVLEGVPLTESTLIISLCEAAAHRHIPLRAKEQLLADARAQEAELLQRMESRHQREVANLQAQLFGSQQTCFIPPPPSTRKAQHVSWLTSLLLGPRTRSVWVRGHYRGRKWIKGHRRNIRA